MALLRLLVRVFFKRVEVEGRWNVPDDRGGILVAWHPNGLIDPALILAQLPGRVVFGARHGLLRIPVLGGLMRALGTVPVYRAVDAPGDEAGRRTANRASLDALAAKVADGSFAALFPEGISHDWPHLLELKSGAARLYYRARQLQAASAGGQGEASRVPVLIPVGLHYDEKHVFRSRALVEFHPPLELPAELDVSPPEDEPDDPFYARARRLMMEIERALEQAVLPTETWELHQLMHRGRSLVRAERVARAGGDPGRASMTEKRLGFARFWAGHRALRASDPEAVESVLRDVGEYDADMRALGLDDPELDRDPRLGSVMLPVILAAQVVLVYLLLPPLLIVGYVANYPPGLLCGALAKRMAKASKDEASLKIIVGSIVFPLTWVLLGVLVAIGVIRIGGPFGALRGAPLAAGAATVALAAAGGVVVARYRRLARETMRALRVRRTRRVRIEEIERLREARSRLHDRIVELSTGLELPGEVAPDGRVVSS